MLNNPEEDEEEKHLISPSVAIHRDQCSMLDARDLTFVHACGKAVRLRSLYQ